METLCTGLPVPSLRCLVGGKSELLASGSIETRPPKGAVGSNIDAACPQLRRDFHRLRANLRSGTKESLSTWCLRFEGF